MLVTGCSRDEMELTQPTTIATTTSKPRNHGSRTRSSVLPCWGGETSCTSTMSTSTVTDFFEEVDEGDKERLPSRGVVSLDEEGSRCMLGPS